MTDVIDARQRQAALDPTRSFIVQAPAGSGKTGLITQRFLTLLAQAERPEEIVAITFTRKAAGEMRSRIVEALQSAVESPPDDPHALKTWELARAALERDRTCSWNLLQYPARLAIQTIDSLCAWLTRRLPLTSGFGAMPGIAEDSSELYRAAARRTLEDLEQGTDWTPAIETLLRHLDNNIGLAESMLVSMLARRDQWLRHLVNFRSEPQRRLLLESALKGAISDALVVARRLWPEDLVAETISVLRFAAANVETGHPLRVFVEMTELPATDVAGREQWMALAGLMLSKDGEWRRRLDKRLGFPAPSSTKDQTEAEQFKHMKARAEAVLAVLAAVPDLGERLNDIRHLPEPAYNEEQWQVVEALCELLVMAAAHLRVVFNQQGQVDFSEISQSALLALGAADAPTDLALTLDYRIRHLLLDEFQDTSFGQYGLLERLTAGWQAGDGRTLFVVGDPMQSIYRFREAEVGLYLRARRQGIGHVALTPLTLQVNFRSQRGIVDWVNQTFCHVLPQHEDIGTGAVTYTDSRAFRDVLNLHGVRIHPFLSHDAEAESEKIIELVREAQVRDPQGSIAILVRARSHLAAIVPALKQAGLRFQAVEIEPLGERPVIQDLRSLTCALLHPADRISWLAILRAPWCGLELQDLHALVGNDLQTTVWDHINDPVRCQALSVVGQQRLQRLRSVFQVALLQRRQRTLRATVERAWLALGAPGCVENDTDLEDAAVFFDLLDELDQAADLSDFEVLDERLSRLFARPDVKADARLQLMTIHKSKGLEFDTVIMPGLGRKAPPDENRLLMWMERAGAEEGELLLAPVRAVADEHEATYAYLRRIDKQKARYESGRVLYVSITRARKQLHLLGHTTVGADNKIRPPQRSSLLHLLWPMVQSIYEHHVPEKQAKVARSQNSTLRRLKMDWQMPVLPLSVGAIMESPIIDTNEGVDFLWAGELARSIGIVLHRLLQRVASDGGAEHWDELRVANMEQYCAHLLKQMAIPERNLADTGSIVLNGLRKALRDERGRWLLSSQHQEMGNELAISGLWRDRVVNIIIDRTFVDRDGVRWIVDYKTGSHQGGDVEEFLDQEMLRYRAQLDRYATMVRQFDERPIRLGLYFPLLGGWREWASAG
ncbi:MAG: UvrD-helicase domain-containing protein [Gammaproteobacteria bacterium]|nr:UvrD-helicase domain-containing protein [Gammaproteobacteria bacterium]